MPWKAYDLSVIESSLITADDDHKFTAESVPALCKKNLVLIRKQECPPTHTHTHRGTDPHPHPHPRERQADRPISAGHTQDYVARPMSCQYGQACLIKC